MAEKVILLMSTLLAIRSIEKNDDQYLPLVNFLAWTILTSSLDLFEIPVAGKRKGSYGWYYGCTLVPGILLCMIISSSLPSEYMNALQIILNDSFTSSLWLMIFFYLYAALNSFHTVSMPVNQFKLYFIFTLTLLIGNFIYGFSFWTLFQITVSLFSITMTSKYLPNCFTCGELVLLLQILFTFFKVFTSNFNSTSVISIVSWHMLLFLISVITLLVLLKFFGWLSIIRFYTSFCIMTCTFLLSLLITSPVNLFTWGIEFLCGNFPYRQVLIGFWLLELILCSMYVMFRTNHESSTTERKLFHLVILLTYVPAILCDIELLVLGSALATSLLILLETVRALRVTALAHTLDEKFRVFLDVQDSGCLILTPVYLLLGQSLPIWVTYFEHGQSITRTSEFMPICIYSALLSVAIGDSAASVIGSKFGRIKWPDSKKTVEGTVSAFLSQISFLILLCGIKAMSNYAIFTIAAVCLVEAFTDQIDNLVLPIFMYFLLRCNDIPQPQ